MGLFGFIDGKLKKMQMEADQAETEAMKWDVDWICKELEKCSSLTKCSGYGKAITEKCKEMTDHQLIEFFERTYRSRYAKAYNILIPIMIKRDLGYKDENGKFQKNY